MLSINTMPEPGDDLAEVPRSFGTRGVVLVACVLVTLATVFFYAAEASLNTLSVLCTDGLIVLLWVVSATLGGMTVLRTIVRGLPLSLHVVSGAALGLGVYSLLGTLLGLAGLLNPITTFALPAVSFLVWVVAFFRTHGNVAVQPYMESVETWLRAPARSSWLWVVAMPFLGISLVSATLPPGLLWKPHDPHPYDVLEYHLQVPREWYEAGRIVPLHHNAFSFFPMNVEVQYLLGMHVRGGPWDGIYFAHLITLAHMLLGVVAVYAILRAMRDPESSSAAPALAGVAAATVPWIAMLSSVAYNEAGLVIYGTLALGWAWIALTREGTATWVVAGAFAGLACGVKYTAVPLLLVAMPLLLLAIALVRRLEWKAVVGRLVLYGVTGAVVFSPWLLRNLKWTGNPVFPEAPRLLGQGHFTDRQVERWERAHSPRADQKSFAARMKAAGREILMDWRYGSVLIPLAVLLAAVGYQRRVALPAGMIVLLLVFWLTLTHLQSRFFVLAVPWGALVVGRALSRRLAPLAIALVLGAAGFSAFTLHRAFSEVAGPWHEHGAWAGAVGLKDLTLFLPERSAQLVKEQQPLALIGDAQAFVYSLPMERLKYRTVFDLHDGPEDSVLAAWLGGGSATTIRTHNLLVESSELVRLADTYHQVPRIHDDAELAKLVAKGVQDTPTRMIVPRQP